MSDILAPMTEAEIETAKAAFPSERAQLQERTAEWLSQWTTAPYGVITEMVKRTDGGPGLGRRITFGLARTLDATVTIWSTKRMDLVYNGNAPVEFRGEYAETEFRNFCGEKWGAPAFTEKELDDVLINMASTPVF